MVTYYVAETDLSLEDPKSKKSMYIAELTQASSVAQGLIVLMFKGIKGKKLSLTLLNVKQYSGVSATLRARKIPVSKYQDVKSLFETDHKNPNQDTSDYDDIGATTVLYYPSAHGGDAPKVFEPGTIVLDNAGLLLFCDVYFESAEYMTVIPRFADLTEPS